MATLNRLTPRKVSRAKDGWQLWWRAPETNGILKACDELGIGFVPYSPLAGLRISR